MVGPWCTTPWRLVSQSHGAVTWRFRSPSHPMSHSPLPHPVTSPISASRGFPFPQGCCAAHATPLSLPRAPSHPSSCVSTPPGRQQPSGAGPQDPHPSRDRFVLLARVDPIQFPSSAHSVRSPPHVPIQGIWPLVPSPGPIGLPVYWHENTASPGGCGPAGTPLHVPPLGLGGEVCSVFCMLAAHAVSPSLMLSFRPHMAECPSDGCPSPPMAEGLCFCCSPPYLARACCCVCDPRPGSCSVGSPCDSPVFGHKNTARLVFFCFCGCGLAGTPLHVPLLGLGRMKCSVVVPHVRRGVHVDAILVACVSPPLVQLGGRHRVHHFTLRVPPAVRVTRAGWACGEA